MANPRGYAPGEMVTVEIEPRIIKSETIFINRRRQRFEELRKKGILNDEEKKRISGFYPSRVYCFSFASNHNALIARGIIRDITRSSTFMRSIDSQTMQIVFQTLGAKILENGAMVDTRGYFASCLLKIILTLYLKLRKLLKTYPT